jgi:carbonic anhydrase
MPGREERPDTLLQEVLAANRHHLDGVPVPRPPGLGDRSLLVVTCTEPRLTLLLPAAMGVAPEEMIQVRNAGARALEPEGDPVRSVLAAVVIDRANEVFVIGHTDCRMCSASTADILDGMKALGLSRAAFGSRDIRTWFGLIASERTNAIETARALRESPLLPPGVPVHALLVDTGSGRLELLEDGYSRAAAARRSPGDCFGAVKAFEPTRNPFSPAPADFESRMPVPPLPVLAPEPAPAPPPPPPKPRPQPHAGSPFERAEDVLARLMKRRRKS